MFNIIFKYVPLINNNQSPFFFQLFLQFLDKTRHFKKRKKFFPKKWMETHKTQCMASGYKIISTYNFANNDFSNTLNN